MKDISIFASKEEYKPELSKIYVFKKDNNLFAVTTDSFRLIEIEITDDFLVEYLIEGYYTKKDWSELCKCFNKKKQDLVEFNNIITKTKALQDLYKDYNYPDYEKLLTNEIKDFDNTKEYNIKFFTEFISLINCCDFTKLKNIENKLYYSDQTTRALLMPLNK